MAGLLRLAILHFVDVGIGVATRSELLCDCLLGELHVDSARVVLDLVPQALASALHRADVAYLELTEPNRRIEVEAL